MDFSTIIIPDLCEFAINITLSVINGTLFVVV